MLEVYTCEPSRPRQKFAACRRRRVPAEAAPFLPEDQLSDRPTDLDGPKRSKLLVVSGRQRGYPLSVDGLASRKGRDRPARQAARCRRDGKCEVSPVEPNISPPVDAPVRRYCVQSWRVQSGGLCAALRGVGPGAVGPGLTVGGPRRARTFEMGSVAYPGLAAPV